MFSHQELVFGEQAQLMRVNEVIEHFGFGPLRNSDELCELLVLEPRETFGDVSRA